MNIYLIADKPRVEMVVNELSELGKVVPVKDLDEIIVADDQEEKVIGVAPGLVDWKLPVEKLEKIKGIVGICTLSAWAQWIDLKYCKENSILVTNTPGANSQSVAEYAIWMMFSLAKKLPLQIHDNFETQANEIHQQAEIFSKTMGVVGLGNIGSRIAKMGNGLGMNVLYWSPNSRDAQYEYCELDYLMSKADFVFNCVETYQKTNNLFSRERISLMKSTACFISVLGGMGYGQEDDNFIIESVNNGRLGGFAVEGEHEKSFVSQKIESGSNVFIPGSYAYFTKEAEALSAKKWIDAIDGIVNKKEIYRVS